MTSKDIPFPLTRDNADELYYRIDVKTWEKLPVAIKVCEEGVYQPRFTNMFLLQNCRDFYELFNIHSEEQYRLLQELKRISCDTAVNNDEHKPGFRLNDEISINLLNDEIIMQYALQHLIFCIFVLIFIYTKPLLNSVGQHFK